MAALGNWDREGRGSSSCDLIEQTSELVCGSHVRGRYIVSVGG